MTISQSEFSAEILRQFIEKQISYNSRKNIFYSGKENKLEFISETRELIQEIEKSPIENQEKIIEFTVSKALSEFYKVNQYYYFDNDRQEKLKEVYRNLYKEIIETDQQKDIDTIAEDHYDRLRKWLKQSNPFAIKIYPENLSAIEEVVCAEYSAEIQMEILGMDISKLEGPVLDIGCGAKAQLVKTLAANGFETFGFDRNATPAKYLEKADWMDFHFTPNHWGTIISNLGFSNHFRHHHLRSDGDFTAYARKYIEILQSLKPGGAFYYAPDLSFIETYLDPEIYEISRKAISGTEYYSVKIRRKK